MFETWRVNFLPINNYYIRLRKKKKERKSKLLLLLWVKDGAGRGTGGKKGLKKGGQECKVRLLVYTP